MTDQHTPAGDEREAENRQWKEFQHWFTHEASLECKRDSAWEGYRAALAKQGAGDGLTVDDYETAFADHQRMVRELDVLLNGDAAAKQASLCDIVAQVRKEGIRARDVSLTEQQAKNLHSHMMAVACRTWDETPATSIKGHLRAVVKALAAEPKICADLSAAPRQPGEVGAGADIKALVNRFLAWPVPASVYPDGMPGKPGRTGTNLLSALEAEEMLRYVLEATASVPSASTRDEIEDRQRAAMNARFANRPKTAATADFDLPASNDAASAQQDEREAGICPKCGRPNDEYCFDCVPGRTAQQPQTAGEGNSNA